MSTYTKILREANERFGPDAIVRDGGEAYELVDLLSMLEEEGTDPIVYVMSDTIYHDTGRTLERADGWVVWAMQDNGFIDTGAGSFATIMAVEDYERLYGF